MSTQVHPDVTPLFEVLLQEGGQRQVRRQPYGPPVRQRAI